MILRGAGRGVFAGSPASASAPAPVRLRNGGATAGSAALRAGWGSGLGAGSGAAATQPTGFRLSFLARARFTSWSTIACALAANSRVSALPVFEPLGLEQVHQCFVVTFQRKYALPRAVIRAGGNWDPNRSPWCDPPAPSRVLRAHGTSRRAPHRRRIPGIYLDRPSRSAGILVPLHPRVNRAARQVQPRVLGVALNGFAVVRHSSTRRQPAVRGRPLSRARLAHRGLEFQRPVRS